jgi:hypothetical protein
MYSMLASSRTINLSESIGLYLETAAALETTNRQEFISRAKFIREQCNGKDGKIIFDQCREDWEIWNFDEEILTVEDFKRGFLWRFRDHTTSWRDNQKAKGWFLDSPEAWFVRRYELWSCDKGFDECIDTREGSYKEILQSLLNDGDYEVLSSPAFSKQELGGFIENYKPLNGDFEIAEIIEVYIEQNPNY